MTIDERNRTLPLAPRTLEIIAVSIILLLAAFLRFNHLDWTEFKQDEAHLSQIAFDMARHGQIPLHSINASVGVANLPLGAWLLAIPYAATSSPIVATAFLAGLNVLAVAACYAFARRCFKSSGAYSIVAALIAALLFATAPWAVLQSRKLWANNFFPIFVVAWAWTGWLAFAEKRSRWLIVHAIVLALCLELHYYALMLVLVSTVWFSVFIRRVAWKTVLIGLIAAIILFAPFIIADASLGWPTAAKLLALFNQPSTADSSSIDLGWLTATGLNIHSLAGPQEFENYRALIPGFDIVFILEGVLMLIGLLVAAIDVARSIARRAWTVRSTVSLMLATWLVIPIVSQISHRIPLYQHYFAILWPVPFLLIGLLVCRVSTSRVLRRVLIGGVIVIAFVQTYAMLTLQQFVASRPTPGGAGIPIGYYESIVNQAKFALSNHHASEIVINTVGADPQLDEYPAIFDFLLNGVPHRFVDASQSMRVYPLQPSIQIDYSPAALLTDMPVRDQISTIDLRVGEQPAQIYESSGNGALPCEATSATRWANGTTFLAAQIDPLIAGQSALIHVCVRLDQNSPSTDYHWTNQLFDKAGKRWAQVDSAGFPSHDWRAGDGVLLTFNIDLPADMPAGDYILRIGQYTYPDIASVPVIDVMNNPQSDAIEIPVQVNR
ncbi:MAG TPA: hypothetical protein VFF70_07110 [Anaerolineae bacterium]|nr:hypothetical protein [Anaerolineae bacterium]